jgi:hypothetical protein
MNKPDEDLTSRFWGRGLHDASNTLIKRGTAMGPLTLLLLLVPVFLTGAWAFRDVPAVMIPCVIAALAIPTEYARQFARFANSDPDRLQSEHYRYEMRKIQMIAAKELPYPVPADTFLFAPATTNPALPPPSLPSEAAHAEEAT